MKYLLIYTSIFFYSPSLFSQNLIANLNINLEIGGEGFEKNYIFTDIEDVKSDEEGRIYVLDKLNPVIKVYASNGEFLFQVGERGKGPGEFLEITNFIINKNEILIFDKYNQRFTRCKDLYAENLSFETVSIGSEMNGYFEATEMFKIGNEYNIYSKDSRVGSNKMFHLFDRDLKYKGLSFLDIDQIWDPSILFQRAQISRGGIYILNFENKYFITPKVFEGKIYKTGIEENLIKAKAIYGTSLSKESYKVYTPEIMNLGIPNSTAYSGIGGKIIYQVFNKSIGIHEWKEQIVNFLLLEENEEIKLSFDLYTGEGQFVANYSINNFKIKGKPIFEFEITSSDQDGNFYLIDNRDYPKVIRFNLSIE